MEFRKENDDINFIEHQFDTEPCINIIDKERFEKRVDSIFNILWEKLSKSFGPGGSGTFISVYPAYYNTKDGFTIMKNIAFDKKLDQVICDMVMNICSRLNFTVGDGTTTAVIATKSTYDAYRNNNKTITDLKVLPREILERFESYKNLILKELENSSYSIQNMNSEDLKAYISSIVNISSNGNAEITKLISDAYEELMYPSITTALSNDGTTKGLIVNGYKIDISLTDKMYVNNDNQTLSLQDTDILIFDHKVTQDTYRHILRPLSNECLKRGRRLVCIAPYYDETALEGLIRYDLMKEYQTRRSINLVLAVCTKPTGRARVAIEDLAMLLNTSVITSSIEDQLISDIHDKLASGADDASIMESIFLIDSRGLNINVAVLNENTNMLTYPKYNTITDDDLYYKTTAENKITCRLGFCNSVNIGFKESTFDGFYYDESLYETTVRVAKEELAEIQRKCQVNGTFSIELSQKQQRVCALGLKTCVIEVGSTSELSQGYLKDTIDDSVKAASSAYNNGVVLGCNVTLISIIKKLLTQSITDIDKILLSVLYTGFKSVYKTVFKNVFPDMDLTSIKRVNIDYAGTTVPKDTNEFLSRYGEALNEYYLKAINDAVKTHLNIDKDIFSKESFFNIMEGEAIPDTLYEAIIEYSIKNKKVFDVTTYEFTDEIINSAETDKEILKATVDLLSLLITGNQLVLR